MSVRRLDPIFGKPTPLLFAHRGGAKEVEESTRRGFRFAVEQTHANVLELDVHVLTDGEIVVWHGPTLSNVYIEGKPRSVADRSVAENDIRAYAWKDLKDRAWVAHPDRVPEDLSTIPRAEDNTLILLEDFLTEFAGADVNIEMKDSFNRADVARLVGILDRQRRQRTILVVSLSEALMDEFRRQTRNHDRPYAMGLSMLGVLTSFAKASLPFRDGLTGLFPFLRNRNLRNVALQTSHDAKLSPPRVIQDVQAAGGAVHVFLTEFRPIAEPIDEEKGHPTEDELFAVLDRGVDGIMTDRPKDVRQLMDRWIQTHPFP
jgi:glycerophosphoryl diester phosphodiesterase